MSLIRRETGEAAEYAYYGINPYIGCSHGCTYCYVRKMFLRYKLPDFNRPRPKLAPVEFIRRLSRETARFKDKRKRVQLSFATDPYQPIDAEYKLTRACIEVLRECGIPFQILTKAGDLACRDFDLYGPDDLFGVTLTTLSLPCEPNAATPSQRMASLRAAKGAGIKTWVSIEPVLLPSEVFEIIEGTHEYVDLYKIGKLNYEPTATDWKAFAKEIVETFKLFGARYYLKSNLARLLPAGSFTNTDWRQVN